MPILTKADRESRTGRLVREYLEGEFERAALAIIREQSEDAVRDAVLTARLRAKLTLLRSALDDLFVESDNDSDADD